ncbi:HAD hydrolase-like protein, partial [Francisella tularensis]
TNFFKTLYFLKKQNMIIAVFRNKHEDYAIQSLTLLCLVDYFEVIVGGYS